MNYKALTLTLLLSTPFPSPAETSLQINGLSLHLGDKNRSDYCEQNPGFGLTTELNSNWKVFAGRYKNSFCSTSHYAGLQTSHRLARYASLTLQLVATSGYPQGPQLLPLPGLSVGPRTTPLHLLFLPAPNGKIIIGIQQTIVLDF